MLCRGSTAPWCGVGASWLLPCEAGAVRGSSTLEMAPVWDCQCPVWDLKTRVGSSTPVPPPAGLGGSVKHFHTWQLHVAKEMSQHMALQCQDKHLAWQELAMCVESRAVSCGTPWCSVPSWTPRLPQGLTSWCAIGAMSASLGNTQGWVSHAAWLASGAGHRALHPMSRHIRVTQPSLAPLPGVLRPGQLSVCPLSGQESPVPALVQGSASCPACHWQQLWHLRACPISGDPAAMCREQVLLCLRRDLKAQ